MSEEQAFRLLRRTPIEDMDRVYRAKFWEFYIDRSGFETWLEQHGWCRESFREEGTKYEERQREQFGIDIALYQEL